MTTTYRAAFGNPVAHKPVVDSLFMGARPKPDTSSDAALAKALAENDHTADMQGPASPSGVKIHVADWEGGPSAKPIYRRVSSDGSRPNQQQQQQRQRTSAAGGPPGRNQMLLDDAALARQLQRVELKAVADATGSTPSLLFPEFHTEPSVTELTLSRTLSRAPSIRVNPRVAAAAPPSEPVASQDRQRLLATLKLYNLSEKQVAGDGNCQFRALSDQLYGSPEYHDTVRAMVVSALRQRAADYSCYVPADYGEYCAAMAKPATWGDHVTLQAAADSYGLKIMVVTSFAESPVINIEPAQTRSPRTLYLSFWAEVHYNSLCPAQGPEAPGGKPPKVLGSRTLGRVVQEVKDAAAPLEQLLGGRST